MRRGRIFFLLALIIVVALALVYMGITKGWFGSKNAAISQSNETLPTPTPISMTKVVVVTQRVKRGDILTADKLGVVDYQSGYTFPNMFSDITQVEGKLARYTLEPYTILTTSLVTDSPITEYGSADALFISPGMVAVSIPITRLSSVSYAPERGDHVNVIVSILFVDLDPTWQTILPNWTGNVIAPAGGGIDAGAGIIGKGVLDTLMAQPYRGTSAQGRPETGTWVDPVTGQTVNQNFYILPSENQRPRLVSQTLIRNAIVLQMGNFMTPAEKAALEATPLPPTPTQAPGTEQTQAAPAATPTPVPAPPDVITLIVSPQDAVTLNYLIYGGAQLTLALRNPNDADVNSTEAVTLNYLLDQYNIPIPVKLPYGIQPPVNVLQPPSLPNDVSTPVPQP